MVCEKRLPWLPVCTLFGVLLCMIAKLFSSVFIQVDFAQKVLDLALKVNLRTQLSVFQICAVFVKYTIYCIL